LEAVQGKSAMFSGPMGANHPATPVQLFGPWTRSEDPHRTISDRLLRAHRDHIHVGPSRSRAPSTNWRGFRVASTLVAVPRDVLPPVFYWQRACCSVCGAVLLSPGRRPQHLNSGRSRSQHSVRGFSPRTFDSAFPPAMAPGFGPVSGEISSG